MSSCEQNITFRFNATPNPAFEFGFSIVHLTMCLCSVCLSSFVVFRALCLSYNLCLSPDTSDDDNDDTDSFSGRPRARSVPRTPDRRKPTPSSSPVTEADSPLSPVFDVKFSLYDESLLESRGQQQDVMPCSIIEEWMRKRHKFHVDTPMRRPSQSLTQSDEAQVNARSRRASRNLNGSCPNTPTGVAARALGMALDLDDEDSFASSCDDEKDLQTSVDERISALSPASKVAAAVEAVVGTDPIDVHELESVQKLMSYLQSCLDSKTREFLRGEEEQARSEAAARLAVGRICVLFCEGGERSTNLGCR